MGVVYIYSLWQIVAVLFNYKEPLRKKLTVQGEWKKDEGKKKNQLAKRYMTFCFSADGNGPTPGAKTKGHDLLVWPPEDPTHPRGTRNDGSGFWVPLGLNSTFQILRTTNPNY